MSMSRQIPPGSQRGAPTGSRKWCAAAILLLLAAPGTVLAQDAARIVGRAGQVYRGLTSLRADFTQTISDRMIGEFDSRGTLVQTGNNFLLMQFTDPAGDRIVLDGTYAWIYTPSSYLTKGGMKSVRMQWFWKHKKWVKIQSDNLFHLTNFSIFNEHGDELS
jgi:outer membrane lipoprotein-sorting protein